MVTMEQITKLQRKLDLEEDVLLTDISEPGRAQPLHGNMPHECINSSRADGRFY